MSFYESTKGHELDNDQRTCVDSDECASGIAVCGDNENCVNTLTTTANPNGYSCVCAQGNNY